MSGVVHICTRWGDYVVGVRDVRRGRSLAGLVRFVGRTPRVLAGEGHGQERELVVGQTLRFARGALEYAVTWWDGPELSVARASRAGFWTTLGSLAAFTSAIAVWTLSHASPARTQVEVSVLKGGALRREPESERLEHERSFTVALVPQALEGEITGSSRCGDALMGRRSWEPADARWAVAGRRDNPDPHLARPESGTGYPGGRSSTQPWGFAEPALGSNAPSARWGRDSELGVDDASFEGRMFAERAGEGSGQSGLGRRSTPGGVAKRIEVAAAPHGGAARVIHTGLRVSGARKPSDVGRVLSAHFAELRGCAARADGSAPRSIELRFTVDAHGVVGPVAPATDAVEQCLASVLSRVAFGSPSGAATDVSYPLHIVPATHDLRPSLPRAPAPTPCDC